MIVRSLLPSAYALGMFAAASFITGIDSAISNGSVELMTISVVSLYAKISITKTSRLLARALFGKSPCPVAKMRSAAAIVANSPPA